MGWWALIKKGAPSDINTLKCSLLWYFWVTIVSFCCLLYASAVGICCGHFCSNPGIQKCHSMNGLVRFNQKGRPSNTEPLTFICPVFSVSIFCGHFGGLLLAQSRACHRVDLGLLHPFLTEGWCVTGLLCKIPLLKVMLQVVFLWSTNFSKVKGNCVSSIP